MAEQNYVTNEMYNLLLERIENIEKKFEMNKKPKEFKPYTICFGQKHLGKPYAEMLNETDYIEYLKKIENPTKGISHFLDWVDNNRNNFNSSM